MTTETPAPHCLIRLAAVAAGLGVAAPPLVVALSLISVPPLLGLVFSIGLGVLGAWHWSVPLMRLASLLSRRKAWLALWFLVALGANVQGARLGRFMLDPSRAEDSVLPWRTFFREHSCLSAYTEAARLAPSGVNVYDPSLYQDPLAKSLRRSRKIGPFEVDLFEYPPPFLSLPHAAVSAGLDFFTMRRAWFAVQALLLLVDPIAGVASVSTSVLSGGAFLGPGQPQLPQTVDQGTA